MSQPTNTPKFRRLTLPSAIAMTLALPVEVSFAQLEEIVVTARKQEEGFLEVPVVSTTLDQAQLEAYQTTNFFTLADRVPGLVIGENVGSVGGNATIRGIGSSTFNNATDGAVAVNVDGMQFSHGGVLRSSFFDVKQVEVLKGPQALFFGKNSPGGIIVVRTEDPGEEAEFMGRAGYESEAEEWLFEGIASGPITDTLSARLALSYSNMEGYFDNNAEPGAGLGGAGPQYDSFPNAETWFGRFTLLFDPTDTLSARLKVNYEERDIQGDGGTGQIVGCPTPLFDPIERCKLDDTITLADLDPAFFPNTPNGGTPYQKSDLFFSTLEIDWDITNNLTLNSVTGYSDSKHEFNINGTFQPGTIDQTSQFGLPPASVLVQAPNNDEQDDFTQELRLSSNFSGAFNFVVGAFYEDGTQKFQESSEVPLFGVFDDEFNEIGIETYSVFGQVIWDINDRLELAVGARYIEEERDLTSRNQGMPVDPAVDAIKDDEVLPEVTLTWQTTDDLTLFAAYKTGWKSGSFNVDNASAEDRSYEPETAEGGELGLKAMLLDDTLRLGAAVYYYEYDDLQVSRTVSLPGGTATELRTVNAATAEVSGIEVDVTYAPAAIEGLTLFAAVNYNQGEFKDFQNAPCYGGQTIDLGCDRNFEQGANQGFGGFTAQDLSGEDLSRSPEWTGSLGFDYERPIDDSELLLGISAATAYNDDMYMDVTYNPRTLLDSYWKTNVSLRLSTVERNWELALIANNITDEVTASTCFSGPFAQGGGVIPNFQGTEVNLVNPGNFDNALCFAEPGRELWVRLTKFF
ncbi:MAG: TonB-dependent receptor [Pseudomonadota bacterium]